MDRRGFLRLLGVGVPAAVALFGPAPPEQGMTVNVKGSLVGTDPGELARDLARLMRVARDGEVERVRYTSFGGPVRELGRSAAEQMDGRLLEALDA